MSSNTGPSGGSRLDPVAVTALVISLVALCTTIGQLLQQYLATADGYRRCQRSVMGDWAPTTRLRWRWREFRFETLFTTPEIYVARFDEPELTVEGQMLLLGDNESRALTMTPWNGPTYGSDEKEMAKIDNRQRTVANDELADWLHLLNEIHAVTRRSFESTEFPLLVMATLNVRTPTKEMQWKRVPAIRMRERSWDFQPPDAIRPMAKTTLSAIAIIARRMGMRWKDFRPEDGVLRAEGNSHTITSTTVRGIGLVLQYNNSGRNARLTKPSKWRPTMSGSIAKEREEIYIPVPAADRFGAGVIYGHQRLQIPDYTIDTQQQIVYTLSLLESTGKCSRALQTVLQEMPGFRFPVGDLVALTSHVIWQPGSPLVQVPAPSDNVDGLAMDHTSRVYFHDALRSHLIGNSNNDKPAFNSDRVKWVYENLESLNGHFSSTGAALAPEHARRPIDVLSIAKDLFHEATKYLASLRLTPGFGYGELLAAHLRSVVFNVHTEDPKVWGALQKPKMSFDQQDINRYFHSLSNLATDLRDSNAGVLPSVEYILEAWLVMMFRSMCWGVCHSFVPGERVPVKYFGSQLPVWIG